MGSRDTSPTTCCPRQAAAPKSPVSELALFGAADPPFTLLGWFSDAGLTRRCTEAAYAPCGGDLGS